MDRSNEFDVIDKVLDKEFPIAKGIGKVMEGAIESLMDESGNQKAKDNTDTGDTARG